MLALQVLERLDPALAPAKPAAEHELPAIHLHIEAARERLTDRLKHLAARHVEDGTNGHEFVAGLATGTPP